MGFCHKQRLEQPSASRDLPDVTNLGEGRDTTSHNDSLLFTVQDLLDGNWAGGFGVDNALIIFDRNEDTPLVKQNSRIRL